MDKARKEEIKSAYICSISGVIGKAGWRKEVLYSSAPYAFIAGYDPEITIYEAYQVVNAIRDAFL